jgi:hypothetical protein
MLAKIAAAPIVSGNTLRPDHLCYELLAEADRLGVELERSLWQPAVAIVQHGMTTVLDLPSYLDDIASDVVSELFDALNWAAPAGCYLGSTEGDGACFMWRLSMEAQAEVINSDPGSKWEAKTLDVPSHWLSALVNGDDSGLDDDECRQLEWFCRDELSDGWNITAWEDESSFMRYHDAQPYGVLACDSVECLAMRLKPNCNRGLTASEAAGMVA